MNLQEILSAVLGESGFLVPTSFVGSPDPNDVQMVYLANRAASYLREQQYQRLRKRYEITLTTATTYALPSDYLEIIPDTMRIVGRIDVARFPTSAAFWSYLESVNGPVGIPVNVRLLEGELNVFSPTEDDVLAFEYVSNAPILASDGTTAKQRFTSDDDDWLLDDDLLILETRWRWMQAKGTPDWQAVLGECVKMRLAVRGREAGSQTIGGIPEPPYGEPYTNLWVSG